MAAPTPSSTTVSLKLLIDPKSSRLLYAEAGKDFVDFLFSIMSLPAGTMIRLLSKQGTAGCIGNIYESIENLGDSYMQSVAKKDILLKPQAFNYDTYVPPLLPSMQPPTYTKFYRCGNTSSSYCRSYMSNDPQSCCPACRHTMSTNFTFVNSLNNGAAGFVKEAVTYMITDDLIVSPMSTKTIISLLNNFNVKDVGDLEEEVISVGVEEGVELLRASMQSKTVLTKVFLGKKEPSIKSEPIP